MRSAKQTASQDTPCIDLAKPPIVGVAALSDLARWFHGRPDLHQGRPSCEITSIASVPPRHECPGRPSAAERALEPIAGQDSAGGSQDPRPAGRTAIERASGGAGGVS